MTKSRGLREHHGKHGTKAYAVWNTMRARCNNPKCKAYPDYGGRGIKVCEDWTKFSSFYRDMGDPPPKGTLERKDNSRGYSRDNCRWATHKEQGLNKRNNVLITISTETKPLAAWAEQYGIRYATVHQRIRKGWPPELAVTTPLVTKRKGVPRGKRIAAWDAENRIAWSDPTLIERRAA